MTNSSKKSYKTNNPPKIAEWLLNKIADSKNNPAIKGDFEEEFSQIKENSNIYKARIWYWKTLLTAIPSFLRDRVYRSNLMLINYIKIAMRNIIKQKGYTFINLAGLAVGMASCLLILLWIQDELSYDQFHKNKNNLYRLNYEEVISGTYAKYTKTPFAAAPVFSKQIPEIDKNTIFYRKNGVIKNLGKSFEERNIVYVDTDFFDMFTFEFVVGEKSVLSEPGAVVLTKETSVKLFGTENPIGKTLILDDKYDLTVSGIIENVPTNSHMVFDYLISSSTLQNADRSILDQWAWFAGWTYVTLIDGADTKLVEEKMLQIVAENYTEYGLNDGTMGFILQKVTDIHLYSEGVADIKVNGDIQTIYLFSVIVIFILLIACINFINLSTARSSKRSLEIGLRKVFGAYKKSIVAQFLSESIIISFLGLLIALILAQLLLPSFNDFVGKDLKLALFNNKLFALEAFLLILIVGIFAGSIPAISFSAFKPIECLSNKLGIASNSNNLRNLLVIFQFSISTVLILSTFTVVDQINFMKNSSLGFNNDQVMVLDLNSTENIKSINSIKNEILNYPDVGQVEISSGIPGKIHTTYTMMKIDDGKEYSHNIDVIFAGINFVDTYKFELLFGSDFNESNVADTSRWSFILNETAAKKFNMDENSIGEEIGFSQKNMGNVVGIIRDFNYSSLKNEIEPLILGYNTSNARYMSIKLNSQNISNSIENIETTWNKFNNERKFSYFFADAHFDSLYKSEDRLNKISTIFSGIAIFIACLGLYGLASFIAEQKTKEIGVRKVLGSSVANIIILMSKNFLVLVLLSNIISWPIAYYLMDMFLSGYAYRIDIGYEIFIITGIITLIIAFLSVGYQTLKSSFEDPIKSLKYE